MILFRKNEQGFSLVELAVAAVVAVALGGITVSVLSGTASSISSDAVVAKDNADCYNSEVIASKGESASCAGSNGGGNGGGSGITILAVGGILSVSVDSSKCNWTNSQSYYYYADAGGGTRYIGVSTTNSFNPTASGYSIGQNLGYGNYITAFYAEVPCGGVSTRSDNDITQL
jgi:hypothetical protein